ncbi:MAG: hypothetical protein ACTTJX_01825 [Fusobacterium sp.]|uniref:hypothetical protein n=1 Tax=Fusobacterium sp. TaxID=68766 RepID=UPI003FA13501
MKLRGKIYSIVTGGVYKVLNINFESRKITGINKNEELTFEFKDVIWLESTGIKEDKKYIYTDDYLLATKDGNLILCGIVKRRKDGVFVLENKKQHKSIPLIELKASGVKLINLQNHKIYFAKKNNKTIKK